MNTFSRSTGLAILILCAVFVAAPAAAALERVQQEQLLAEASAAFTKGAAEIDQDRAAGLANLERSAALFSRLIDEGPVRNGGLYYNLANAYLLKGDLGRAVLNYRRAETLIPGDPNLVQNLAYARSRIATRVEAASSERVRSTLLFWNRLSERARFWVFVPLYLAAWTLAAFTTFGVLRSRTWWITALFALGAGLVASSLFVAPSSRAAPQPAVVIAPSVTAYKGPDADAYEPSFRDPLSAGLEVTIIESRPGWALIELADNRRAWLNATAVEPVAHPSRP